ncbi:MAG TPA: glycosyltransferase family 39 protein, partial [Solirubrobacteraceae bacterium]|nr:glycosyltransferase family 39 protein [Solirubrobacteraceae bacterium]
MRSAARRWDWAVVGALTAAAALLRSWSLSKVSPDPFYDAAVRSMTLSLHNFFFGAFEPGGSVSIDKPPVDLWLQVASVKLFGFSSTTLKIPEVVAGTLSVPLLFAAVRRMWSRGAGIAAAAAMAILPIEVITARSDTMDAVMMALVVVALLLLVRAVETDRTGWLLGAAAALGLAFNVKLLESLVALPGLLVFAYAGLRGTHPRRVLRVLAAGAVFVVVSLSWLTATLVVPKSERPWAIGSTNGSAWNAAFVFNGTERLSGRSPEPGGSVFQPGHHYREATQEQRNDIPIVPPSATRLLERIGPLSGQRLGIELLLALLLGLPAFALSLRGGSAAREREEATAHDARDPVAVVRMRRASAAGLIVWLACGIVLFSHMARLHPRYVEGFTPAVAATLGIGVAWATTTRGWARLAVLGISLAVTVYYTERLLYGTPATWWIVVLAALAGGALALVGEVVLGGPKVREPAALAGAAALVLVLVAVLAVPFGADVTAIEEHVTDAGYVGALPSEEQRLVSAYLREHQGSARYEVAAESATQIGSLVVQDARPILVLSTYNGRVFTNVPELQHAVAKGEVRYAFLNSYCPKRPSSTNAACS